MILNSPYISGSLTVTGNTTIQGQLTVTGSLSGTASLASNALLLQGTGSTGFATTASINEVSASQQSISASLLQVSASYIALSGSYNVFSGSASTRITENSSSIQQVSSSQQQISSSQQQISASLLNVIAIGATTGSNSFRANQSITGSLVVSSTITAQTLIVQTVTSSIVYSSGSNNFGNQLANTQTFTGSVNITGSLTVNTTGTEFQVNNNGVVMGNVLTDNHSITGSLRVTGSTTIFGNLGVGITAGTNGAKLISAGGTTSFFDAAGSRGISINPSSAGNIHQITSDYIAQSYYSIAITARGNNNDLFISASGNIGIGTTAPNRLLDVSSGGDTYLRVTGNRGNSDDLHVSNVEFYNSNSTRIISEVRAITGTGGTQSNSGQLAFYTNCAGTYAERMRITSGGNVGIGTSTVYSGAKLHILGGLLAVEPTNGNTNSEILLGRGLSSLGTCAGSGITAKVNFAFEGSNDNFYQEIGFVTTTANQTRINSAADFYISTKAAGSSSPTERMRIGSTGIACFACQVCVAEAVYVSGAFPGVKLDRGGTSAQSDINWKNAGTSVWSIGTAVKAVGSSLDFYSYCTGDNVFKLTQTGITCFSGTVCAPCFATISDYRMKSNVRPIAGLSIIMNTKPYKFEYNYDCSTSFGMIAHELQDTVPEAVFGQKDGETMQGVDYMKLLPIAIKAIQELKAEIDELKNK